MPDLAPGDFYLFNALKGALGGKKFDTDDDMKAAVHHGSGVIHKIFFPHHLCVGEALAHMHMRRAKRLLC